MAYHLVAVGLRLQEDAFRPERQKQRLGSAWASRVRFAVMALPALASEDSRAAGRSPRMSTPVLQDRSLGTEPYSSQVHMTLPCCDDLG